MTPNTLQRTRRRKSAITSTYPEGIVSYYRNLSFAERENLVHAGFTKNQLVSLKTTMSLDYCTLADLLAVTTRCLHLKKGNDTFSPNTSDRIAALLELFCDGLEIFTTPTDFNKWLSTSQAPLNNRRPLDVAKTHPGLLKIRELMFRIRIAQL